MESDKSYPKSSSSTSSLTVASYNIHSCVGTDKQYEPIRIARVIHEIHPDIIALQEVDNLYRHYNGQNQIDFFRQETGMKVIPGPTLTRSHASYGNALLTRLPIQNVQKQKISFGTYEPRGLISVELRIGATTNLFIIATHLGLHFRERFFQMQEITTILEQQESPFSIIMGDFNEWFFPRPVSRNLKKRFGPQHFPRTFPSRFPLFALDKIWIKPQTIVQSRFTHSSKIARIASDHLPVVAHIDLPNT